MEQYKVETDKKSDKATNLKKLEDIELELILNKLEIINKKLSLILQG